MALDKRLDIPFPINTPELKKDHKHLDYAYIGSRYDKRYAVLLSQLKYWQPESNKLMEVVKTRCSEHINKLKLKSKEL